MTDKAGTPTTCTTQRVAYCVGVTRPVYITWQAYCARTKENCERRREYMMEHPLFPNDEHGVCRPTLNIDPHAAMEAPPALVTP